MYYACMYISKYIPMTIYTNTSSFLKSLFHVFLFLVYLEPQKLAVVWAFLDLREALQTTGL